MAREGSAQGQQLQPTFSIVQQQVAGVQQAIRLVIEQNIASLPPTSPPGVVFEYNPVTDLFEPVSVTSPTVLRTPRTIGKGRVGARVSTSYFSVSENLSPIAYGMKTPAATRASTAVATGMKTDLSVWIANLAFRVGVTDRLDVSVNFPLVNAHATATSRYTVDPSLCPVATDGFSNPSCNLSDVAVGPNQTPSSAIRNALNEKTRSIFDQRLGEEPVRPIGTAQSLPPFPSGNGIGLGRIEVEATYLLMPAKDQGGLAFSLGVLAPSPDTDGYAGVTSMAVSPTISGALSATENLTLLMDVGGEADFDTPELSHFAFHAGGSYAMEAFSVDLGVGGAQYVDAVRWTPKVVENLNIDGVANTAIADGSTTLGITYINFIAGARVRLYKALFLSGALAVPIADQDFQPGLFGTFSLDGTF